MDSQPEKTVFAPRQNTQTDMFQTGETVGSYRIERVLGAGGMGVVYLIKHTALNKHFALKALPAQLAAEKSFVTRFKNEATNLARLKHAHIVNVTDFGESQGKLYLVLEFVDGGSLEDWFEKNRVNNRGVPAAEARRMMMQILLGLEHAHKAGIIHRDLKPANVLLEKTGEAKIADFGLARAVADEEERRGQTASPFKLAKADSVTTTGAIVGTIDFMSPEARNSRPSDARSDIYAVGVMTYYLVTGRKPHGLAQQATKLVPGLDPRWDKFIAKCLEDDPANRYQTAGEALAELESMGRAKGNKWTLPFVGVGAAAAIGVGVLVAVKPKPREEPPVPAITQPKARADEAKPEEKKAGPAADPALAAAQREREVNDAVDRALKARDNQPKKDEPQKPAVTARAFALKGLPEGARVIYRGKSYATDAGGRVSLSMPPGAQGVRVIAPNHQDWEGEIGASETATEETITMALLPPRPVRFTGLPAGASVTIDGKVVAADASGAALFELRPGRVRVTATAPKHLELAAEHEIRADTESIALALERIPPPKEIAVDLGGGGAIKFRLAPAGISNHGAPPEEKGRQRADLPWTKAEIPGIFYIAETETTQQQHRILTGKNPSVSRALGDETRPVEQVAWRDITGPGGAIEKLNDALRKLGLDFTADLPTEIEWEYACRAGTETAFHNGQNLTNERDDPALNVVGHYMRGVGLTAPAPVAKLQANAWGLHDMHGNVAEWTYSHRNRREPVLRGGHWKVGAVHCRAASRIELGAETRPTDFMGYRLVLRPKE
jgi:tRNA A-37 threonylcarbamoyl transferase component Bud32